MTDKEINFLRRLGKKTLPGRQKKYLLRIYTWSASPVIGPSTGEILGYKICLPCYASESLMVARKYGGGEAYWADIDPGGSEYRIERSAGKNDDTLRLSSGVFSSLRVKKLL